MPIPSFCIRSSTFGALLFSLASISAAPDWSVWRGPQGNGHYDHESTWSHDWPATGPKQLWQAPVHLGYSGIAISENRAYTVGNSEGEDIIQCLDVTTGKPVWTKGYPQELIPKYNPGGPNAPPAIEGKWLYILSKQGLVSCLDKSTGESRWRTDLTTVAKAPMPTWGFSSCPIIVGDKLFLNANKSGLALNKNTGKLLWNSPAESCGYAATLPLRCRDQDALAIFGYEAMHVVAQSDGTVLWKVDWPTKMGENSADPLVIDNKLYLSSWWGMGAALFDPNKDSTEPIWINKEFQNHIAAPVLHRGHLYGFDGPVHKKNTKGFLRCINATSGETVWTQEDLQGSLIVSQNKLLILTNIGSLIVAEASPKGFTQLARHTGLGKRTWAPPVLHQGRLYTRDADGSATCLDLRQTPP
ncbi:MAG: PQQ-binding-like beta-propeller repeat protein [Akkermansiaceae bacterium]|nr:PQQ-binding-like beta-propeller repeat protein [Akkermansiaceae bacterium]